MDTVEPENSKTETFASLDAFKKATAIPFETFSFNVSESGNITASKGSVINGYPNSLVTFPGNPEFEGLMVRIKELSSI